MLNKVKYLFLVIGLLFLIPACTTGVAGMAKGIDAEGFKDMGSAKIRDMAKGMNTFKKR